MNTTQFSNRNRTIYSRVIGVGVASRSEFDRKWEPGRSPVCLIPLNSEGNVVAMGLGYCAFLLILIVRRIKIAIQKFANYLSISALPLPEAAQA